MTDLLTGLASRPFLPTAEEFETARKLADSPESSAVMKAIRDRENAARSKMPRRRPALTTERLKRLRRAVIASLALLSLAGCGDVPDSLENSRVTLYSGGKAVRKWKAIGHVREERAPDGFKFIEEGSHRTVYVIGEVVVENP